MKVTRSMNDCTSHSMDLITLPCILDKNTCKEDEDDDLLSLMDGAK